MPDSGSLRRTATRPESTRNAESSLLPSRTIIGARRELAPTHAMLEARERLGRDIGEQRQPAQKWRSRIHQRGHLTTAKSRIMCSNMNQPMTRRSAHDVGEAWTTVDATELYEIARWGQGLLLDRRERSGQDSPDQGDRPVDRPEAAGRSPAAARHQPADAHPVSRHPAASPAGHLRGVSGGDRAARIHRPLHLRLSDQGQSAAPGRRGGLQFRQAVQVRPRSGLEARAAGRGGARRQRHAHHLQRVQGRRVHRDGDAGAEDRPQHHPGGREIHRARPDSRIRRGSRRPAEHRHAREAGGARRRPLAVLGRLPLEVRADGRRNSARAQRAEDARHGRLLPAAPLPPRQPDPQHPHRQGRAQRGGARLRRARARPAPA